MNSARPMESVRIQQASQGRHVKQSFVPPFKASTQSLQMPPPSPPALDDVLSQMSQRDFSSTQLFRTNSEHFNRSKDNGTTTAIGLPAFDNQRPFSQGVYNSHQSDQNRQNSWLTSGSQLALSTNLQPSLLIDDQNDYEDEYLEVVQDSPELFSQWMDLEHTDKSEGFSLNGDDQEEDEIYRSYQAQVSQYNFDAPSRLFLPAFGNEPEADSSSLTGLRSVNEIPNPFRSVFSKFPYFNIVQSRVFDEVMYTDKPMVVCAPTGSGKTVIFELAIIRQLMNSDNGASLAKIVYMAPMKALCSERFMDWKTKFEPFGLKCKEVTGDSELDDYFELQNTHVIMTTPEKWDSMTRKWRDNRSLVQSVRLFLIDEVHLLNDDARGATVEAVISRMKTVQSTMTRNGSRGNEREGMRLIAISATIPNVEDIAAWLGGINSPALHYSMDDSHRPVRLRKVVLGFPKGNNFSEFRFDLSLNYKLSGIIQTYSDRKPTLVFCTTRKSAQQAAQTLVKDARFIMNSQHRQRLQRTANSLHDSKLRELVICGIGYHHAGLDPTDRRNIEAMFIKGDIPVLFATSTLAVGVNLPAHLVIIKSTAHYVMGVFQEYSETQILQMIGRAGRPQFDTSATAVILTTESNKGKYSGLLEGTQKLESSLHHHLIEHLNAEIVLNTITDVSIALEWLKSTFLYIRILKNPRYYGIPEGLEKESLEQKLQEFCLKSLNTLEKAELIKMDDGFDLKPTEEGRLMARYCIAYDSMEQFIKIKGKASLSEMVELVSKCKEFSDVKLRVNEKRVLNTLNKDKNKLTIRFPISGRIKTTEQKVNCLIQATLGSLTIAEFSLNQDVTKIFRSGQRITRCLTELQMLKNDFIALQNSLTLAKCVKARLWENSKFVSRQLEKIGPSLSTMMVNAGLTTFKKIEETNPREIEMIVNRHPPFGNQIRDAASNLPKYELSVQQTGRQQPNRSEIIVTVTMTNYIKRWEAIGSERNNHSCVLMIGDADNKVVFKQRLGDAFFMKEGYWSRRVDVQRAPVQSSELTINLISQDYVGLDVSTSYIPSYTGNRSYLTIKREPRPSTPQGARRAQSNSSSERTCTSSSKIDGPRVPCSHHCLNKKICGHDCCKQGIISKTKRKKSENDQDENTIRLSSQPQSSKDPTTRKTVEVGEQNHMDSFLRNLHQRTQAIPGTPAAKRLKMPAKETGGSNFVDLTLDDRFGYTRKTSYGYNQQLDNCPVKDEIDDAATADVDSQRGLEEIGWPKTQVEEQHKLREPSTYDNDCFDDGLPCFSVDELWNDDELALDISNDYDSFASPVVQNPGPKEQNVSHSHYFKSAESGKCQRNSFETRQSLSSRSQFIIGSQQRKRGGANNSRSKSKFKRLLSSLLPSCDADRPSDLAEDLARTTRGSSRPVSPPPLASGAKNGGMPSYPGSPGRILLPSSPGSDDFEPLCQEGTARNANNKQWKFRTDGRANRITSGINHEESKWSSEEFLPDELENDDWGISPIHPTLRDQRNTLSPSKRHLKITVSSVCSTVEERKDERKIYLEEKDVPLGNSEFKGEGSIVQSPISSSFFCSRSLINEQEHEEQDAFAGIFNGLL